ncbi:MAG: TIM44-like domain-containing protein [Candidatus Riflebacteria bacterium]|nr:TIM44-like domain-containing protein [Candidatus Riflebacteria bacterium]
MKFRSRAAFFLLLFVLFFTCYVAYEAYARAGGGQGYKSSSSSSSRSYGGSSRRSGGSGGEGIIIELFIRLIIHHPMIGIPLTIGIILFFYYGGVEGKERYVDFTIRKGMKAQNSVRMKNIRQIITSRDPGWNEVRFLERMKQAFMTIQNGWSKQDLRQLQNFVSDGVFERFNLQLAEQKDAGIRDHFDRISIRETGIAQMLSDEHFDTMVVYFRAEAVNYRVDAKTGRKVEGTTEPEEFEEYWSFIRKPGAKTLQKPGLIEGSCPNCSAPIDIARTAKCTVCGSFLRSGEYDWVLSEITQAQEWFVSEPENISGLKDFNLTDPGFNTQHIEDLCSVIFYRYMTALRKQNIHPIQKYALESFCEKLNSKIRSTEAGVKPVAFHSCAVGSVDLANISQGEQFDNVSVKIKWAGYPVQPGVMPVASGWPVLSTHYYVLKRRHGVITNVKNSLSSSACPNCGAPESDAGEFVCKYCQTASNDGSQEWVLETIETTPNRERIQNNLEFPKRDISQKNILQDASIGGLSKSQIISWMIYMMRADGVVDQKEIDTLKSYAKRIGFPAKTLNQMIEQPLNSDFISDESEFLKDRVQVTELIKRLASVALADGRLSSEEQSALEAVAAKADILPLEVRMIVTKERNRMYQEAKAAIKNDKSLV